MAKDNYDTIVFKVLIYLYAVLKRKINFNENDFYHAVSMKNINESYFTTVLYFMTKEGLIDGPEFTKAWGQEYILCSELSNMIITPQGIHYLEENKKMNKIKNYLIENVDIIVPLINMIL